MVYTGLPGDIHQSYQTLMALLQELGLEISTSKLIEPTNIAICLGIEINSVKRTLRIPDDKLKEIQEYALHMSQRRKSLRTTFNFYWVLFFI